ncbi:MAG: glycosyltransferase family 1 protein [Planctomycetota bacterium]|nr:MAG: glycosyltransferase family 1 protein [Planctomycetota bacterium]
MKVAITDTTYAADGYAAHLARRLLAQGHEVDLYCRELADDPEPGVRLQRIPDRWKAFEFASAWSFDRWLTRRLDLDAYDVVHGLSHSSHQDITSARQPLLHDQEESRSAAGDDRLRRADPDGLHRKQLLAIEKRRYTPGAARKVIAPSRAAAERLRQRYALPEETLTVLPNGVDTERFRPENCARYRQEYRERVVCPQEAFVVLCAGNGFRRRGVPALVEAARAIRERGGLPGGRELRIAVVGHDTQRSEQRLLAEARARGVGGALKLYGEQPLSERWLAMADVAALPSRFDPFADSVLEAMATGLPVIASCEVGAAELIEDGRNGLLLHDRSDAQALADRILRLASDPEGAARMGAEARRTAEAHAYDRHVEALLALYEEVAAAKKRSLTPA